MSYTRALRTVAHPRSSLILAPSLAIPSIRTHVPHYARGYATTESKKPVGSGLLFLGLGLFGAGAGYYLYTSGKPTKSLNLSTPKPFVKKPLDYTEVYKAIANTLEENDAYDDGSYGPILVRLAWHASGTYNKEDNTGGSNGATMRYNPEGSHAANVGLNVARDHLEKIKQTFPEISYSDLWTLAGVVAIQEMGGPIIPWRSGRQDHVAAQSPPDGRLPDAALGSDHIRKVFYRMGMNDQEIVALLGGHALGRCHRNISGYEGPWTPSPTVFTNDFYNQLLTKKWAVKKWDGPKQYEDKETKELMMLPTDLALITDKSFKKYVELYAKDEQKFFEDFAKAYQKLVELGVQFPEDSEEYRFTPIISQQ